MFFFRLRPVLFQAAYFLLPGLELQGVRPLPFGVLALHGFDLLTMHAALICGISCGLQLAGKQLRANVLFTFGPVLLQVLKFLLPGLQLLAEGLFPLPVSADQRVLLFTMTADLFGFVLRCSLLNCQHLSGRRLLAFGMRFPQQGKAKGQAFDLTAGQLPLLLDLCRAFGDPLLAALFNQFVKSGAGCAVQGKLIKDVWRCRKRSLKFRMRA